MDKRFCECPGCEFSLGELYDGMKYVYVEYNSHNKVNLLKSVPGSSFYIPFQNDEQYRLIHCSNCNKAFCEEILKYISLILGKRIFPCFCDYNVYFDVHLDNIILQNNSVLTGDYIAICRYCGTSEKYYKMVLGDNNKRFCRCSDVSIFDVLYKYTKITTEKDIAEYQECDIIPLIGSTTKSAH
jgi:hypothetical protein